MLEKVILKQKKKRFKDMYENDMEYKEKLE